MSFVVRRAAAFVHPLDWVPGYVVPDGEPARRSFDRLPDGGVLLPGPKPDQLWVLQVDGGTSAYHLVDVNTGRTGLVVDPPRSLSGFAWSDGDGYLLLAGSGGVYDLRRGNPIRLTTGRVVATGPRASVVFECGPQVNCQPRLTVVDQGSGDRRRLPGSLATTNLDMGKTSPDGSRAVIPILGPEGQPRELVVVDLDTGAQTPVDVEISRDLPLTGPSYSAIAWSPDGRWLFVVAGGALNAVDARTGEARPLGLALAHPVRAIAVRP